MADYYWPEEGLVPFAMSFYLQPHTGRSQSPFNRQQKVYETSAPLWVARLSVRGGYDGMGGHEATGAVMDALIARLRGGTNRIGFWDFRRDAMRGLNVDNIGNLVGSVGDTSLTLTNLVPGETVLAGDYIGGDGRPHIITGDVDVGLDGTAVVSFQPPLTGEIALDAVVPGNPLGWFRLVSDDAGLNATQVGSAVSYDLDFVEDWLFAPAAEVEDVLRISGIIVEIGGETVEMS